MTLACEVANSKLVDVVTVADVDNSKLVEVVTVADVDDDDRVDDSLVTIWELRLSRFTFFARVRFFCPKIRLCKIFHKFHVCLIVHHIL